MKNVLASIFLVSVLVTGGAAPAAASLPSSIQMGRVPLIDGGAGWAVALPLEAPASACRLTSDSPALKLVLPPGEEEAWLVLEPTAAGPATGLLEIATGNDVRRHTVAGDVVAVAGESWPPLLVLSAKGTAVERRYLRIAGLPGPTALTMDRARATLGDRRPGGWIPLEIEPGFRMAESRGHLALGTDDTKIEVQYSVVENITVLARTTLPAGWRQARLLPIEELLEETGLRARVALLGRRDGRGMLRIRALKHDRFTGLHHFEPGLEEALPNYENAGPMTAFSVRVGDRRGARARRLVTLADRTAGLWDPAGGLLGSRTVPGFRASRAAARSMIRSNTFYALRHEVGSRETYLRRWRVMRDGGRNILRGRLSETSLEQRLRIAGLRSFALAARRNESGWPGVPVTENLLLLAVPDAGLKARARANLYSLTMDAEDPSRIVSARRRFQTRIRWAIGDPSPFMNYAHSPLRGGGGFPARLEIGIAGLTPGRYVNVSGVGGRFTGSPYVETARHDIDGGAFGFETPVFMATRDVENHAFARRYRYADTEAVLLAAADLGEASGIAMVPSRLRGHSWAVTGPPAGSPESVRRLRVMTAGLPAGFNFPPRADAGPDILTGRRLVDLRVRAADLNGDPLAIRWSAPEVEFGNPNARRTRARFPVGTTRVRVAVRERNGTCEDVDFLTVVVDPASPVPDSAPLASRLTGIYPNPANPRLTAAFVLETTGPVRIAVHDLAGRLVRVILDEVRTTGAYDVDWDGRDQSGRGVASGVYLVRLTTGSGIDTGRAVLVR